MEIKRPKSDAAEILGKTLLSRIEANPAYSLRAFARDLGVSHGFLSQVLNKRRDLSPRRAHSFGRILRLSEEAVEELMTTSLQVSRLGSNRRPKRTYTNLEQDQFRTVSQWYHIAILDLTLVKGFRSEISWIAKRLGISSRTAQAAVTRLLRLGLLEENTGKWIKANADLAVPTACSSAAMRSFHREMMAKAASSLTRFEYAKRDITGSVIATNPERFKAARKKIERFRRSLMEFLSQGECTELYHLGVQLFPLTQQNKGE